ARIAGDDGHAPLPGEGARHLEEHGVAGERCAGGHDEHDRRVLRCRAEALGGVEDGRARIQIDDRAGHEYASAPSAAAPAATRSSADRLAPATTRGTRLARSWTTSTVLPRSAVAIAASARGTAASSSGTPATYQRP